MVPDGQKEYRVQCPFCKYDEYQVLYDDMEEGLDSGIKCPNCEEATLIVVSDED